MFRLLGGGTRYIRERILKPKTTADGYRFVALSKNGKTETGYIHRLVAEAFIPNLKELPEVNHKDGRKANNNLDNLEWVTHQENVVHAYQKGLYRFKRLKSNNFPTVI